ncbi:MAG: hypothetical protein Q7S33_05410 [Nanoarchaeota archaeon]|nr:hypothetical protein [Nanoarchaeota archaeon]
MAKLEKKIDLALKICQGHINLISSRCNSCAVDYNPKKHPNNYDCPDRQIKEIVEGICIEHIRYITDFKTAKEACASCTSDFENHKCEDYYPYPPIKYEEFVKEAEKRNHPILKDIEKTKKYIMLLNIGILKSGKKEKISYDEIIEKMQFFLNEKRKVDIASRKI